MRAVVLTAPGLEHAYVTNTLLDALGDQVVGVLLESRQPSLESAFRRYPPWRVGERLLTKAVRRALRYGPRKEAALRRVLGTATTFRWRAGLPVITVSSLNDPASIAAVRAWMPTHLFVYGTGLVGREMRESAPLALNLHTGLSPDYRGSDTEFWPLYHGRPDMVGATVHVCTASVDAGDIYDRARATLHPTDDPFIAFARAVQVGAELYARVARALAAGAAPAPTPQDLSIGRAYRFIDRTLLEDLRMEYRVRTGRLRRMLTA